MKTETDGRKPMPRPHGCVGPPPACLDKGEVADGRGKVSVAVALPIKRLPGVRPPPPGPVGAAFV